MFTLPLLPLDDVPELNDTAPLTPPEPLLAEATLTVPLAAPVPAPLVTVTLPPLDAVLKPAEI
jgi:hypothetical protein